MRLFVALVAALVVAPSLASKKDDDHVDDLPLGVPPSRAALYKPGLDFQCLDGSMLIPYEQMNDDYCDCPDGSDEPGTAACPNGQFYCSNRGHSPHFIPSSRVNDRICDCCDGSDEYDDKVTCPNICDQLGASAREEKERRQEVSNASENETSQVARKGYATRQELAKQAQALKEEKEKGLNGIKAERDALVPQRDALEPRKKELEEKEREAKDKHRAAWEETRKEKKREEATALFKKLDADGDEKITVNDLKKNIAFDTNQDGTVEEDEAKIYMNGVEEADLETFIEKIYDTVRLLLKEDLKPEKKKEEKEDDEAKDEEEEKQENEPKEEHWNEKGELEEYEEELEKTKTHENNANLETNENGQDSGGNEAAENEDDKDVEPVEPFYADREPPYDEETQKLIDEAKVARDEYFSVDNKIRDLDEKIKDAESFITADYGPDGAWAALKGQCFELEEGQYTYKLCPFDKTSQKDRNGHGETTLGYWKEWVGQEPLHKYHKQKYDKGQQCWNGPERSTEIVVECGDENKLIEASEPGRCEYRFVFRTPVVCNDPEKDDEPIHTEL